MMCALAHCHARILKRNYVVRQWTIDFRFLNILLYLSLIESRPREFFQFLGMLREMVQIWAPSFYRLQRSVKSWDWVVWRGEGEKGWGNSHSQTWLMRFVLCGYCRRSLHSTRTKECNFNGCCHATTKNTWHRNYITYRFSLIYYLLFHYIQVDICTHTSADCYICSMQSTVDFHCIPGVSVPSTLVLPILSFTIIPLLDFSTFSLVGSE